MPSYRNLDLRNQIIDGLRSARKQSRVELAKKLNISPATIGRTVQEMVNDGWLLEQVCTESTAGRPRVELTLNADMGYAVVVDIDVRSAVVGLVDFTGRIIYRKVLQESMEDLSQATEQLSAALSSVLGEIPEIKARVWGVGIAVPGTWNTAQRALVFTSTLHQWQGIDLQGIFRQVPSTTLVIDNDAKAAALGEMILGAGRPFANFIYVRGDVGIGSAMVHEREIIRGQDNLAGGMGHMIVAPEAGKDCRCGRRGCLEAMAGLGVVEHQLESGGARGPLFGRIAGYFAIALANLGNLFCPEGIVMDGQLFKSYPELFALIVQATRRLLVPHIQHRIAFVTAEFEPDSALLGMAMHVFQNPAAASMHRSDLKTAAEGERGVLA